MLTAMRIFVVVVAGTFAFGELEAARVYTAPTLLIVNGIGGFLFATYAAKKEQPLSASDPPRRCRRHRDVRRGDRRGAVAAVLLPWAGDIVTGGDFPISTGRRARLDRLLGDGRVPDAVRQSGRGHRHARQGLHVAPLGVGGLARRGRVRVVRARRVAELGARRRWRSVRACWPWSSASACSFRSRALGRRVPRHVGASVAGSVRHDGRDGACTHWYNRKIR